MTWILALCVIAAIAAMMAAFLAVARLDASVKALEERVDKRLSPAAAGEATTDKGASK